MGEVTSEVTIEEINSVKKKLSFEIPWSDVKNELDSAYLVVGKKAKIKGFRPGKVPRKVLEVHYRDEAEGEAISNLVSKSYLEALEKNDIIPIDQPVIDQKGIDKEQSFNYTATVEIHPVVEPKDYTGIEVAINWYSGFCWIDARASAPPEKWSSAPAFPENSDHNSYQNSRSFQAWVKSTRTPGFPC